MWVLLGVMNLCLVVAMIGATTLVQQDSTQFIDAILLSRAWHLAESGRAVPSEKLAHVQNGGETNGMLLFLALHGIQIVHETQQGEMKHRGQLAEFREACCVLEAVAFRAVVPNRRQ